MRLQVAGLAEDLQGLEARLAEGPAQRGRREIVEMLLVEHVVGESPHAVAQELVSQDRQADDQAVARGMMATRLPPGFKMLRILASSSRGS